MIIAVMTQSHEKSPFLTFFILLGKTSSSGFGGTQINYASLDSFSMSYLDCANMPNSVEHGNSITN